MGRRLGKNKLDKFKKLFLEEKEKLADTISKNNNELDASGDEIDLVQSTFISDMQNKISSRDLARIRKIDEAVLRIDTGEFGICEECEKPIPEKRLSAMPYSVVCINCAEKIENLSKQYAV